MVEPGAAVKRFLNATECYVLQSSAQGHYMSLITRDPADASRWMMVSMLIDNGCSLTGRQALAALTPIPVLPADNHQNHKKIEAST